VTGVIVTEGNSGTTDAVFQVRLSKPHLDPVTVDYATEDDYAAAPGDYAETSGTLTFAPGVTSKTVTVPIQGDTLDEFAEAFYLNLSNPVYAFIADGSAAGTIRDDDPTPGLSVDDVSLTEPASGPTTARFTVGLSAPSGKTVLADYSTADGTARVADGDYAETFGTLTFRPGATSRTVSVSVNSDTVSEPDEGFFLDLSGALNATLADGQGEGTLKDAPPPPDTTSPTTVSVTPREGATEVSRSTNVTATFSEEMNKDTLVTDPSAGTSTTVKLFKGGSASTTQIPATVTVSEDGKTVTLDPSILLAKRTTYTAKIVGAKDLAGNALPDKAWSFKTAPR
jgi:hypothetical protein